MQLAHAKFQQWQAGGRHNEGAFTEATDLFLMANERNPLSPNSLQSLGECWRRRFDRTKLPADVTQAVVYFRRAAERYPTDARIVASLADAANLAEQQQDARVWANQAMELDQVNRDAGHVDRQLPEDLLKRLNDITNSAVIRKR